MSISRDIFIAPYIHELEENIAILDKAAAAFTKDPDNILQQLAMLRALHTINGSSCLLQFSCIGQISHGLEHIFQALRDGRLQWKQELAQLIFISLDFIHYSIECIKKTNDDAVPIEELMFAIKKSGAGEACDVQKLKTLGKIKQEDTSDCAFFPSATEPYQDIDISISDSFMQIQISEVDQAIQMLHDLIIKHLHLKKIYLRLEKVEKKCLEMEKQNDQDFFKNSRSIYNDVCEIKTHFTQQLSSLQSLSSHLQTNMIAFRMRPISFVLDPLQRMVEEKAKDFGKQLSFTLLGAEIKLDTAILQQIKEPIVHLLYNAIEHGIELPLKRVQCNKPAVGTIKIICQQKQEYVTVDIIDDGQGIDYAAIKVCALQQELDSAAAINSMSEEALIRFLFVAGFSTKKDYFALSGRGIGMNVVQHTIDRIKGQIHIISEKNKGTTIRLRIPLSLTTIEGFFVFVKGHKFFIAANFVREVIVLSKENQRHVCTATHYQYQNTSIAIYALSNVLRLYTANDDREQINCLLIVQAGGELIGLGVEGISEQCNAVLKPLPKNLRNLKIVQGIVFDDNFSIVNVLYIGQLIENVRKLSEIDQRKRFIKNSRQYKNILLVDDSPNTREIVKSILEPEQYHITAAVDGIEALDKAHAMTFQLIITDVHMPRMDGITLIENLRREEKYKNTPIIILSSSEMERDTEKLKILNTNAVIVKEQLDRSHLLILTRQLIG